MTPETGPASDPAVQPNVDGSEQMVAGTDEVEATPAEETPAEEPATPEAPAEEPAEADDEVEVEKEKETE